MLEHLTILEGKNILIVDDDNRNTFALSSYLEELGIRIHTAASGLEALEMLANRHETDLVLMDMMMPEMDGYETIERIRMNPATNNLPVIAVTAKAMIGDREKCLEAGASEYVSKPVNMKELLDKMATLIQGVK
jgi:two-component system, chemotaxis family, sensor kinase CheA